MKLLLSLVIVLVFFTSCSQETRPGTEISGNYYDVGIFLNQESFDRAKKLFGLEDSKNKYLILEPETEILVNNIIENNVCPDNADSVNFEHRNPPAAPGVMDGGGGYETFYCESINVSIKLLDCGECPPTRISTNKLAFENAFK